MKKIYIITFGLFILLSLAAVASASGSDKIEIFNVAAMVFRGSDSASNLQISAYQSPWWIEGDYITVSYTIPDPGGEGYLIYMADHVKPPAGSVSINSGLHTASIHYPGLVLIGPDGIEKTVDFDVTWTGDKVIETYRPEGSVKDQYGNVFVGTGKRKTATITGSISGDLNLDVSSFTPDMLVGYPMCEISYITYRSTPVM